MKLKKVVKTKLAKVLAIALLVGSVSNTGFAVKAEEIQPDNTDVVVETTSVSGNAVVAVEETQSVEENRVQDTDAVTLESVSDNNSLNLDNQIVLLAANAEDNGLADQAAKIGITFTANKSIVAAGGTIKYTLEVTNKNDTAVDKINFSIATGELVTGASCYTGGISNKKWNSSNRSYTFSTANIAAGATKTVSITITVSGKAALGSTLCPTITGTLIAGTDETEIGAVTADKSTEVTLTDTVILAGARTAKWFEDTNVSSASANIWSNKAVNGDITKLVGQKMTLDCTDAFKGLDASYSGVDANGVYVSGGPVWQCVGFVAFEVSKYNSYEKPEDLKHYVFYSGESENTVFYEENCNKTADDVKEYIKNNNGILYGETVSQEFVDQLKLTGWNKGSHEIDIAAVWYVTTPEKTWTKFEDYEYTYEVPKVPTANHYTYPEGTVTFEQTAEGAVIHYASEGVTITTTPALEQHREDGTGKVEYGPAVITITIHDNAPNNVRINLSDAIGYLNGTITGANAAEPGDTIYYTLKFVNESNKNYNYDPASAQIGTIPASSPAEGEIVTVVSNGFDGYAIGEVGEFSYLPRRILNVPLQDLGISTGKVTDKVVGEALLKKGYGTADMAPEKITQTYLAQYYLDWFNNKSREEGNKVTNLTELTEKEFAVLTGGDNATTVLERCPAVAEALYYTTYHNVYTFDGKGLYDRMQENGAAGSYADTIVSGMLRNGEAQFSCHVDGELATNGFLMTKYGFGMQFALSYQPENTPAPTPIPTPTPTPSTTDESDESEPTPTPSVSPEPDTPQVLGARRNRMVTITDDPIPLADRAVLGASRRPQTGDDSGAWNLGFLFSLTGLGAWIIIKRRE